MCSSPSCNFRAFYLWNYPPPLAVTYHFLPSPPLANTASSLLVAPVLTVSHPCIKLSVPLVCSLECDSNIMCQSCICVTVCRHGFIALGSWERFHGDVCDKSWETWGLFLFSFWMMGWLHLCQCLFPWVVYQEGKCQVLWKLLNVQRVPDSPQEQLHCFPFLPATA